MKDSGVPGGRRAREAGLRSGGNLARTDRQANPVTDRQYRSAAATAAHDAVDALTAEGRDSDRFEQGLLSEHRNIDERGIGQLYSEEGQLWLRMSAGHSVSEQWLEERAPDLYARWWGAPSVAARDRLALEIEQRLEELESAELWEPMARRHQQAAPVTPLADRVAAYETSAAALGATPLDDPGRAQTRRAFQAEGDALRAMVSAMQANAARGQTARRLDAADLVADRPFIEALGNVSVDRLAVATLAGAADSQGPTVPANRIQAEMVTEDPHAALRADVLLAVDAAGHDLAELQQTIARHGVDLREIAPALAPASDFYARHAVAIDTRLDREIAAAGHRDLPSYVASWTQNRPATGRLHDIEQGIVEHVVGSVVLAADPGGRQLRQAHRMWERAANRAELGEWSAAIQHDEIRLRATSGADRQLEVGAEVDDDVPADPAADREIG